MVFYFPGESKWMLGMMYSPGLLPRKHCTSMWFVAYVLWGSSAHHYSKHTQWPSLSTVSKCNAIYMVVVVNLFILIWWWHSLTSRDEIRIISLSECIWELDDCLSVGKCQEMCFFFPSSKSNSFLVRLFSEKVKDFPKYTESERRFTMMVHKT